jgi:hypothetical protein
MRADFDLQRRAIVAELHRRRAGDLRKLATDRSMSAVRQEMEAEAVLHEKYADDLMDYVDAAEKVVTATTVQNSKADLEQLDVKT